jgi:hypothetical protein
MLAGALLAAIVMVSVPLRPLTPTLADNTQEQNKVVHEAPRRTLSKTKSFADEIVVGCDRRNDKNEVFFVYVFDKDIGVELWGREFNELKAAKIFPIYSVTGKVSQTGEKATSSKIAFGQKLPPDNERSWTVYFGDHGENSLAMAFTSFSSSDELNYYWKGKLNMQPGVKEDGCFIGFNPELMDYGLYQPLGPD